MLRQRPKTWAIFALICIAAYLVSFVAAPWIFTGISKLSEINKYESSIQEEQLPQETEPVTDEEKANLEMEETLDKLINIITNISRYIGIMITVLGIFQVILAFKDDDADRNARAISMTVVGGAMMGASFLLPTILGGE